MGFYVEENPKLLVMVMVTVTVTVTMNSSSVVKCMAPEDPIQCSGAVENSHCSITNSYGAFPDRSICRAAKVVYPTSEAELIAAVAEATMSNTKIKVATRYSSSIPKLVCPDGEDGLLISTKYLNRTLNINASAMTITVESGVTLRQLIADAAQANMALPYAPYWWGLTVGGMMGTGAHGSSLWGLGSQVHDYVTRLTIVSPAQPHLRILQTGDPDMDAAKVSLGVLGVISQVTFKLEPLFKRSITYITNNDSTLGEDAVGFGRQHEFADLMWSPSQKLVTYRIDDRVQINTSGNGLNDFLGFRSTSTLILELLRTISKLSTYDHFPLIVQKEKQESDGDAIGKCISGEIASTYLRAIGYGLTNDGTFFNGYPVIGYQNRIQSSGTCLDSPADGGKTACPWDPRVKGLFFHQTTFCIGLSRVKSFIEDVQKLMDLAPTSLCGVTLYNGILMRYVTVSTAYLGKQEDCLDFDISYYRSKDPLKPRLYQDIIEEVEQIAVFKYDALPHWGKNRNVAFIGAIGKYKNAAKFLEVKQKYDPVGLFSSEWTDQMLGLRDDVSVVREGCALEGLCICSQDIHCAPTEGSMCVPGKVYDKARVCAKLGVQEELLEDA